MSGGQSCRAGVAAIAVDSRAPPSLWLMAGRPSGRADEPPSTAKAGPLPLIQYCFRTYGSEGMRLGWLDLTALNALSSASQEW